MYIDLLTILLISILLIVVIICELVTISYLIKAAKMKGHHTDDGTGMLWLIGIFTSPIVLGIYIASLPDRAGAPGKAGASPEADLPRDLPAV